MHKLEYTRRVFTINAQSRIYSTCSRPAIWILEQGVKSVQSWQKHQNDLIRMKILRNIDDVLMCLLWTDSTPFLSISFLN